MQVYPVGGLSKYYSFMMIHSIINAVWNKKNSFIDNRLRSATILK